MSLLILGAGFLASRYLQNQENLKDPKPANVTEVTDSTQHFFQGWNATDEPDELNFTVESPWLESMHEKMKSAGYGVIGTVRVPHGPNPHLKEILDHDIITPEYNDRYVQNLKHCYRETIDWRLDQDMNSSKNNGFTGFHIVEPNMLKNLQNFNKHYNVSS